MMQTEATPTKSTWLDEALPAGVLDNEQTEQLWDACCASCPGDPFSEWEKQKEELR
jgi:hypothetical protein